MSSNSYAASAVAVSCAFIQESGRVSSPANRPNTVPLHLFFFVFLTDSSSQKQQRSTCRYLILFIACYLFSPTLLASG